MVATKERMLTEAEIEDVIFKALRAGDMPYKFTLPNGSRIDVIVDRISNHKIYRDGVLTGEYYTGMGVREFLANVMKT